MTITCYNTRGEAHDFHPGETIPPGWYNSPDKAKRRGVVAAPLPPQKKEEPKEERHGERMTEEAEKTSVIRRSSPERFK